MKINNYLAIALFIFKLLINNVQSFSSDVIGCGGFVKSIVNIDYSRVSIKLYTSNGNLKYTSDCAPNNGYYFIPVYNKDNYILEIDGAKGWKFEPKRVYLSVDGSTDLCSQNQDINFDFKGFTITGKTLSNGLNSGPEGLKVTLKSAQTNNIVQVSQTVANGDYIFEEVLPGYYEILADLEQFKYVGQDKISVSVTNDNVQLSASNSKEVITISGYDIKGQVLSDNDPIKGVNLALYSMSGKQTNFNIVECDRNQVMGAKQVEKNLLYVCHNLSDLDGFFKFGNVPPGKYKLYAFYRGTNIEFEVKPTYLEVTVEHGPVFLGTAFKVEGFSVSGRILTHKNGKGIAGAQVQVTDEKGEEHAKTITTSEDGVFYLENMKAETYNIQVLAPHIFFEMKTVKLSPSFPHIPDIIAYAFEVCGKIKFTSNPVDLKVTVEKIVSDKLIGDHMLEAEPEASFCTFLQSGSYRITPLIPDDRVDKLTFSPSYLDITVVDEPILDLTFNQFAAKIEGSVVLKEKNLIPNDILISLYQRDTQEIISTYSSFTSNFKFKFESISPGNYTVKVIKKGQDWCWENDSYDISIIDKNLDQLIFKQKGFYIRLMVSHQIKLEVIDKDKSSEMIEINEVNTVHQHCLSKSGQYKAKIHSCHRFISDTNDDTFTIDANSEMNVIKLHAIKHKVTASLVAILPPNTSDDVSVNAVIKSDKGSILASDKIKLTLEKASKDKNGNTIKHYYMSVFAKPFETITFEPNSNQLLFKPSHHTIKLENDCLLNTVSFKGRAGLFIKGNITPKLNQARIKILRKADRQLLFEVQSDEKGEYIAGPLDCCHNSDVQDVIELDVKKEGYVFRKSSKFGDFVSKKLSSVIVKVVNANIKDEPPLKDVLISLSGGSDNFRKNLITPENGQLSFIGLNPGQYFFRAVLKEYRFDPSSQILNIKQDETIELTVKGVRVAFSCYGYTNSLSEEPEPNVVVEAVGFGEVSSDGVNCSQIQEEAVSDALGNFRIRDLKPNCNFRISIKSMDSKNSHISRSIPESRVIKIGKEDVHGVRLIVLYKSNSMEVTGDVITKPEYWSSLKLKFFSDSGSKPFLLVLPLTSGFFFIPHPLQLDNRWYTLKLESSLPSYLYSFDSSSITFQANTSYQHFQFYFNPKKVTTPPLFYGDQDHPQSGLSYTILLALITIALLYNYNKIVYWLQNPVEKFPFIFNLHGESSSNQLNDETANMKRKVKSRKV